MRFEGGLNEQLHSFPNQEIKIDEIDPLGDGTPVLRGRCAVCGYTEIEPLNIEYTPRPVRVGDYWLPMVTQRGNLTVCAFCGQPIFPSMGLDPVVLFVRNEDTGEVVGEVDLCLACKSLLEHGTQPLVEWNEDDDGLAVAVVADEQRWLCWRVPDELACDDFLEIQEQVRKAVGPEKGEGVVQ